MKKRLGFAWMGLSLAAFLTLTFTPATRIRAAQAGGAEQSIREVVGNEIISIRPLLQPVSIPVRERVLLTGESLQTVPLPEREQVPGEPAANRPMIERLATDASLAPQTSDASSTSAARER